MHPCVYREFERICRDYDITGRVLEIGAMPNATSLLWMDSLRNASERIGVNLDGPYEMAHYSILKGNANSLDIFDDDAFDFVLCNGVLGNDRFFWKTAREMKRVLKPGGIMVVGVTGFRYYPIEKAKGLLFRVPLLRRLNDHPFFNMFFRSTLTFQIINTPGDYYRFSADAMTEALLEGLDIIDVKTIMVPPRIIGHARKPKRD